ncbi:MAG: tetratricopeptide repeat protein [Sphingobacteriaceae bacterium]|nr:tetratricopeptide repeat protein [Sphingobacteriaceae bacterium]
MRFPENSARLVLLYLFFIVRVLFTLNTLQAQNSKIDSLYTLLKSAKSDSSKVDLHFNIARQFLPHDTVAATRELKKGNYLLKRINNIDFVLNRLEWLGRIYFSAKMNHLAFANYQEAITLAKKNNQQSWQSKYYYRIAYGLQEEGFTKQALPWFDTAIVLAGNDNDNNLAKLLMDRGRTHYENGDYKSAIEDYMKSQKLFEKRKQEGRNYGYLMHYIGSVFKRQNQFDKAQEYYEKELEYAREIKDRSLEADALYLCAQAYGLKGDVHKDMEFVQKALVIFEEEKNPYMVSLMYANLADGYSTLKNYKKAIECLETSVRMDKELGQKFGFGDTYASLGDMYSQLGQHNKAIWYLNMAMDETMKMERKQLLNKASILHSMAYAYSNKGDYKTAFYKFIDYKEAEDSLNKESNIQFMHELETKYGTEKKEKEIALLSMEKKLQEEEIASKNKQQKTIILIAVLGIAVALVSAFAFIQKQKTAKILSKQVNEINYQNEVIKEKNKDITDSIQYAKRLQEAVFPQSNMLNNFFAESFVLFQPKDIVSGDFYWFEQAGDKTIVAVGDCTGHGVPGAFMSILGHNLLNQIVMEYDVNNPADILRLLDKQVSNALNKKGNQHEYNDGMDIAICAIDKKNKKLEFAGANRPLIIKRGEELIELKANKFAIGGIQDDTCKLFTQHTLDLELNDVLYLFSDGYYDQFGGPNGKKFKYRKLLDQLKTMKSVSLVEQKITLENVLESWKGSLEQLDDICVIGVKV